MHVQSTLLNQEITQEHQNWVKENQLQKGHIT